MKTDEVDVLVVGGGPAGLSAAIRLKRRGVRRVVLLERWDELGGIPLQCHHLGFGLRHLKWPRSGPSYARFLAARARESGVVTFTSTTALEIDSKNREVFCVSPRGHETFRADAILLATGCRESTRAAKKVPGFRGKWVLNTSQLQQFVYQYDSLPGKEVVIVGSEDVALSAVHTLGSKAKIRGMIERGPHLVGHRAFAVMTNWIRRVPLYKNHAIQRVLGRRSIEGVEIVEIDRSGDVIPGTEKLLICDTLVFSGDFIPENELVWRADLDLDAHTKGPVVDQGLTTSAPGIFAAGNLLRGAETGDIAAMEGEWAAECIVTYLQAQDHSPRKSLTEIRPGENVSWVIPQRWDHASGLTPPGFLSTLRVKKRSWMHRLEVSVEGDLMWRSRRHLLLAPERRIPSGMNQWRFSSDKTTITVGVR